jgi:hypothetical protein
MRSKLISLSPPGAFYQSKQGERRYREPSARRGAIDFHGCKIALGDLLCANLEIAQRGIEIVVAHQILLQLHSVGQTSCIAAAQLVGVNVGKSEFLAPSRQGVLDRPGGDQSFSFAQEKRRIVIRSCREITARILVASPNQHKTCAAYFLCRLPGHCRRMFLAPRSLTRRSNVMLSRLSC